ncbi:hypothetical protein BB561_001774 [Smittium simulii]|uniref:Major facilitator superfamily (MFS) profile domain-containing protein n=1 Tax=Smittium simulii TaxID=133385 RepID=A0A2T9YT51_9FUNG|nr:hypothetical protein BB561_001774 [Smittium simulii]
MNTKSNNPSPDTQSELSGAEYHGKELAPKYELPKKYRILVIVLVCMMSFGSQFSGISFNYLKPKIIEKIDISYTKYGVLQSSSKIMNTFMPFVVGIIFDINGSPWSALIISSTSFFGMTLITISSKINSYSIMVIGRIVHVVLWWICFYGYWDSVKHFKAIYLYGDYMCCPVC